MPGNFDEAWYLLAYPDVEDAINAGSLASGSSHYVAFGFSEGRLAFDDPDLAGSRTRIDGNVLNGGSGDDSFIIVGQPGVSYQTYGETGNDTLQAFGVADNLNGGSGDDTYNVSSSNTTVVEGINGGTNDTVNYSGFLPTSLPANVEVINLSVTLSNGAVTSSPDNSPRVTI